MAAHFTSACDNSSAIVYDLHFPTQLHENVFVMYILLYTCGWIRGTLSKPAEQGVDTTSDLNQNRQAEFVVISQCWT